MTSRGKTLKRGWCGRIPRDELLERRRAGESCIDLANEAEVAYHTMVDYLGRHGAAGKSGGDRLSPGWNLRQAPRDPTAAPA